MCQLANVLIIIISVETRNLRNFFTQWYLTSWLRGFSLESFNGGRNKKTKLMPLPDGGKRLTIYAFV